MSATVYNLDGKVAFDRPALIIGNPEVDRRDAAMLKETVILGRDQTGEFFLCSTVDVPATTHFLQLALHRLMSEEYL